MTKRTKENERRTQYHPPMCASLQLEFRENKHDIICECEYILNTKPNSIDVFIIKKNDDVVMESGLGAIFKKYNIIEYKSPKDELGYTTYHRVVGYLYLLIAYKKVDGKVEDITITFIREAKPEMLMNWFANDEFAITEYETGIYHMKRKYHPDMQVVVTGMLGKQYRWITKLTDKLEFDDVKELVKDMDGLDDEEDMINAESVCDLVMQLNKNKDWYKEVTGMGYLRDMFREEFREEFEKEIEEKDRKIKEMDKEIEEKQKTIEKLTELLQKNKIAML